ncbi:hypothetical protein [Pseudomonas sp. RL]|uniref:hypothetical protein n=1 Tax=Pseudomonas sp. RL TaxID=1452718 RepID=UPI0004853C0E|nr:hypothetical protein [Pseudomonas sp. RL]
MPPFDQEDLGLSPGQLDDKYNPEGGGEHPYFTRQDWHNAVATGRTMSGYWDWLYREIHNINLEDLT